MNIRDFFRPPAHFPKHGQGKGAGGEGENNPLRQKGLRRDNCTEFPVKISNSVNNLTQILSPQDITLRVSHGCLLG